MSIGFISGTSVSRSPLFQSWESFSRETEYGRVPFRRQGALVALNRHGPDGITPPHAINHRANIRFFSDLGVEAIVSLNSVGSLKRDLPPGTLVSCSDYVSFRPMTFQDRQARPVAPRVGNTRIPEISRACDYPVETGRIYVQTRGPRFETRAEVRIIRDWGDVVGMTLAHEADLCAESEIDYNSLAIVDNFANGLFEDEFSHEVFQRQVKRNQAKVDRLLEVLLELYG